MGASMTEAAPEAPAQEQPNAEAKSEEQPKADETDWKAEARKWEQRAKDNSSAAKEAEKARLAAMTESDRAIEEAKQSARQEAAQSYGKRLATADIRAEAATAGADLAGVFDYLDLGRFVTEDGEPDAKAIKAFVNGLPKKETPPPSFDGGSRTTATAPHGMSSLIRKAAGRE